MNRLAIWLKNEIKQERKRLNDKNFKHDCTATGIDRLERVMSYVNQRLKEPKPLECDDVVYFVYKGYTERLNDVGAVVCERVIHEVDPVSDESYLIVDQAGQDYWATENELYRNKKDAYLEAADFIRRQIE